MNSSGKAYKPSISCISLKNDAATAFIFSCIRECPTFKMHGKMCNFILRTHYFCSTLQNSGGLVVSVTPVVKLERAELMHYWQEVLKVMGITGRNPSSRIKDSQIRGRSPSIWEFFFLLQGLKPVISNYL